MYKSLDTKILLFYPKQIIGQVGKGHMYKNVQWSIVHNSKLLETTKDSSILEYVG